MVVAIFNLVSYSAMEDWTSVWVFVGVASAVYGLRINRLIGLTMAILVAAVVNLSAVEGMTKKKQKKAKNDMFELEGLAQNTSHLVKRQKSLFDMASKMEPMMKQVTEMMKNMPEGFMETAMENLKQKLNKNK